MDKERIERIERMEESYNRVRKAVDSIHSKLDRLDRLQGRIRELESYQESGEWLKDFEADERGEIPSDIRRGVLSEDALYDLLTDLEAIKSLLRRPH